MTDIKSTVSNLMTAAMALESEVTRLQAENAKLTAGPDNRKKLTAREVGEIRRLNRTTSLNQRELADAFDVNPATVSRIVRNLYWK